MKPATITYTENRTLPMNTTGKVWPGTWNG